MKYTFDKDATEEVKILCPFCNAAWTAEMAVELDRISAGCDTCGHGGKSEITVRLTCTNCDRVVYAKETEAN